MSRSVLLNVSISLLLVSAIQTQAFADDAANDSSFHATQAATDTAANESAYDANPGAKACILNGLKEKLVSLLKKTPLSENELDRLSKIKVSDIFPDSEAVLLPSGRSQKRAKISGEQTEEFNKAWDELRHQRVGWGQVNPHILRKAVANQGGVKGHPTFSPEELESFRQSDLRIGDVQDRLIRLYMAKKNIKDGDFEGFKKFIAPESPYFLAKLAIRGTKILTNKMGTAISGGITVGIATSLYKPLIDLYNKEFKHVTTKAMDQLPENKAYADSVEANQKIEKHILEMDFTQLPSKKERIKKWEDIESLFKTSHDTIRVTRSKVKAFAIETEQTKKITTPYLRANRITYLTSFEELAKDKSPESRSIKALALANFKAQDVRFPPSDAEAALTKAVTDKILDQIAEDPEAFQQFINEFVSMQSESAPQS